VGRCGTPGGAQKEMQKDAWRFAKSREIISSAVALENKSSTLSMN